MNIPPAKSNRALKKKSKKSISSIRASIPEVSSSLQIYKGLIKYPFESNGSKTFTCVLESFQTVSSDAAGKIATVFGSNPSSAAGWANATAAFSEFRVLGFDVEFYPDNRYSKATTNCVPGVGIIDRRSNTALASFTTATSNETCRRLSIEDPWKFTVRMENAEESQFKDVGAPVDLYWIKLYFQTLGVSLSYGQTLQRWRVQFRTVTL